MDFKKTTLKGIGKKLREEARDIVEAQLPERLGELLRRLKAVQPSSTKVAHDLASNVRKR